MKLRITILLAFATLIAASTAIAATSGLTVIGSGKRSATGSRADAHVLYLRGYGHHLRASAIAECVSDRWNGGRLRRTSTRSLRPGQLSRLVMGNPYAPTTLSLGDCTVTATLRGTGRLRLQILAR